MFELYLILKLILHRIDTDIFFFCFYNTSKKLFVKCSIYDAILLKYWLIVLFHEVIYAGSVSHFETDYKTVLTPILV